jgi:hypothetical protein
MSTVACDRRCISNVGEDVECDEYISELEARQVLSNKSGGRSVVGAYLDLVFHRMYPQSMPFLFLVGEHRAATLTPVRASPRCAGGRVTPLTGVRWGVQRFCSN